jgi:putative ABC transport system substrate-binding protein
MRRIGLAVLLALSLFLAPLAVEAQQTGKVPRIGFLQGPLNENVVAFIQELQAAGYVDGQSAVIETRRYAGAIDRLPQFSDELVALKCDVIFATAPYAIAAATRATSTIPIVGIDLESDPVAQGWATSLSRPGRNFTGVFLDLPELSGKQVELLKEAVPKLSRVAVLWDSTIGDVQFRATEAAARTAGVTIQSLAIQRIGNIQNAFAGSGRENLQGIIILSSPLINQQRSEIVSSALKRRLPTISLFTSFPESGGLMAYGPNLPEMYKRAVTYIERILKGSKPSDLPIERPNRFELVINLKTAKALGLTIPQTLLQRADQLIE